MTDGVLRSREQPRLLVTLALACTVGAFAALTLVLRFGAATGIGVWAVATGAWVLFDTSRCRAVTIAREGMTIGTLRLVWNDVEDTHVREVPRGRAGYFIRLTDEARRRLALPAPRYGLGGFGLAPPPALTRYDFFLRADPRRLLEWFEAMNLWLIVDSGKKLILASVVLSDLTAVRARVVVASPDSITIELIASSIEALAEGAGRALASVLPDVARWDPTFTAGVMVFVGPLSLAAHPQAENGLAKVKQAVGAQVAGTPRTVEAIYARRS